VTAGLAPAGALAVALAAALVVAGCGSGSGSGGREGGGGGAAGAFCDEYAGYQQQFSGGASYGEVLDALRDLDPPPEVADDFEAVARAVETMATVDTSDPAAVARFQETTSAAAQEANANIIEYAAAECPGFGG
jgi:hypothetical protein